MSAVKPSCRIVSSDYLDRDVYLNICGFYEAAGFRLIEAAGDPDLLVVLRGDNGSADQGFAGPIHLYDYVREYRVDWARRYPAARSIALISLEQPPRAPTDPRLRHVRAYLPVIPELWTCPSPARRGGPVHVSNYKRMPGDPFQEQLLALIRSGRVRVHGGRWELVGVRARPLSYRQANRLIAASSSCFGLMWPYQRGTTLSGRMWQAPLNGCFVFSEPGTDLLGCPGVLERPRFDADTASLAFPHERGAALAREAAAFWRSHTEAIASALGLELTIDPDGASIRRLRGQLLLWDLEFRVQQLQAGLAAWFSPPLVVLRRSLARLARALGVHPRQLKDSRRGPHQ
ncbi:MAG: hypothetical protein ACO3B3_06695 [Cyanobium sp.]